MSNVDQLVRTRFADQGVGTRRNWALPGGAKLAVWVVVNVEHWSADRPMPRTVLPPPMHKSLMPDLANWSWHEYGMRVGYWRFVDVLSRRKIRPSLAINGSACSIYVEACKAALSLDWEFMGHGLYQMPMHDVADQLDAMVKTREAIHAVTGRYPIGWESPGITQTRDTVNLLAKAGYKYVADWVVDDVPFEIGMVDSPIVSLPYTVEVNDVVMSAVQGHGSDMILQRGRDQFNQLYREASAGAPKVMTISIHPYLTGVPHRIGYLEQLLDHIAKHEDIVFATGEDIYGWYMDGQ